MNSNPSYHHLSHTWVRGLIRGWNSECHSTCLRSATIPASTSNPTKYPPPDLSTVPKEYHDPGEVFSKSKATPLPPHRSYDCSIDLHSGTSPPRGNLFSLSAPERLAMDKYIGECLATSLIRPSSSPDLLRQQEGWITSSLHRLPWTQRHHRQ